MVSLSLSSFSLSFLSLSRGRGREAPYYYYIQEDDIPEYIYRIVLYSTIRTQEEGLGSRRSRSRRNIGREEKASFDRRRRRGEMQKSHSDWSREEK